MNPPLVACNEVKHKMHSLLRVLQALLRTAAEHALEVGLLKLAMHAPTDVEETVSAYYRRLGFMFSRTREVEGLLGVLPQPVCEAGTARSALTPTDRRISACQGIVPVTQ